MNLRLVAAEILAQVLVQGHSLTSALNQGLPKLKDQHDKAFVQAACYGVVRHYFELDFALNQLLSKPLKTKDYDIKALLLLGLFQLQSMRVKSHAAVSETVAACKHKPWAKALVNAVLRQYLRNAKAIQLSFAKDLQAKSNHPNWLIALLQENWPDDYQHILSANHQSPPMALRVNLVQGSRDDYLNLLTEQGIAAKASEICPSALILDQAIAVDQLPGFKLGRVSVQDVAAQLAAGLLDSQPGQKVLDLCAAPGGKTAAILELQPTVKSLLAVDVDEQRLIRVRDNLQRLNLNAEVLVADAVQAADWSQGQQFERILLDAPCSGIGVIRRHPDIKLLRRESDIPNLVALQSRILEATWPLLTVGGKLLYATCSVLKAENELQIAEFLSRHADAQECVFDADWGISRPHGRQILTGELDGFYYALLTKVA